MAKKSAKAESSASSADVEATKATALTSDITAATTESKTETVSTDTTAETETIKDSKAPGKELAKEIGDTFAARPDIAKAYVSTDGKQWFFDKVRALKHLDGFSVVDNPHYTKKG